MEQLIYTGCPAFPVSPNQAKQATGMTLRDWFAGQALAGLLAGTPDAECGVADYSYYAYRQADAMLKEREATDGK